MQGRQEIARFDGNQLDPKGMSIGAAERAANAKAKELSCPTPDAGA